MKTFLIQRADGSDRHFASCEDDQDFPDGYSTAEWSIVPVAQAPDDEASAKAALEDDVAATEEFLVDKVERQAEDTTGGQVRRLRRQVAIILLWQEIQLLKLANATGNVPADALDRAKMFPTLMALVQKTGNSLAQVATAAENRLWDRVRKMALTEATLMLAIDAIRAAVDVDGKFAAADAVDWTLN